MKESPDEGYYRILIDKSQEEIVAKLEELKAAIEGGDLKPWEFRDMKAIWSSMSATMRMLWNIEKSEMRKRHVLFQEEDRDSYVRSMLDVTGN